MSLINGPVVLLIVAIVAIATYAVLTHEAKEYTMNNYPAVNHPEYDELVFRAEGYGAYYAARRPGIEEPLSGEWSDDLTPAQLYRDIGMTQEQVDDLEDTDSILCSFEELYRLHDTDETGWKFPPCICPSWDHENFRDIAEEHQCPAHNGDAWTVHANRTRTTK